MSLKGYSPAALDDPIPYLDDFALCDAFGWSWQDCQNTPADVRSVFGLVLETRAAVQKSQER